MKTLLKTLFITLLFTGITKAQNSISISELSYLNNTNWEGELMYLDYSSGKESVLKTTLEIILKENKIALSLKFDNEPKANTKKMIKLKKKGTYLGDEKITKIKRNKKNIIVITTYKGKDNGKPVTFLKTYTFSETALSIVKKVQSNDGNKPFIRNQYNYTKTSMQ